MFFTEDSHTQINIPKILRKFSVYIPNIYMFFMDIYVSIAQTQLNVIIFSNNYLTN